MDLPHQPVRPTVSHVLTGLDRSGWICTGLSPLTIPPCPPRSPWPAPVSGTPPLARPLAPLRRLPSPLARVHRRASQGGRGQRVPWPAQRPDTRESCLGRVVLLGWPHRHPRSAGPATDCDQTRDGPHGRRSRRTISWDEPRLHSISRDLRPRRECRRPRPPAELRPIGDRFAGLTVAPQGSWTVV